MAAALSLLGLIPGCSGDDIVRRECAQPKQKNASSPVRPFLLLWPRPLTSSQLKLYVTSLSLGRTFALRTVPKDWGLAPAWTPWKSVHQCGMCGGVHPCRARYWMLFGVCRSIHNTYTQQAPCFQPPIYIYGKYLQQVLLWPESTE